MYTRVARDLMPDTTGVITTYLQQLDKIHSGRELPLGTDYIYTELIGTCGII